MNQQPDGSSTAQAIARTIIDANLYMVLGTAGEDGRPWVSPVFYAAHRYTEFYWISSPETTHSQNIAKRPQVSIVVFDSRVPAGSGQAVYMAAVAEQVAGDEVDRALEIYPGPAGRGARTISAQELRPPGPYRLYRAVVSEHFILCLRERALGQPCPEHGIAADHRAAVTP